MRRSTTLGIRPEEKKKKKECDLPEARTNKGIATMMNKLIRYHALLFCDNISLIA